MTDIIAHIVIDGAYQARAKALVNALSSRASGMFETPLSVNGLLPATHFISSGYVDGSLIALLANPVMLKAVCDSKGFPITLEEVTMLISSTQYSTDTSEDAQAYIARIGLKQIL